MIISGHDAALVAGAARKDWVRAFPSGDSDALAAVLDGLARTPLPRPARTCAAELGVPTERPNRPCSSSRSRNGADPRLPALIAVIGPVEPALLTAWAAHYQALGIERFLLAFHFPDHVDAEHRDQLQDTARRLRREVLRRARLPGDPAQWRRSP